MHVLGLCFHDVDNIWVNPRPVISLCLGLNLNLLSGFVFIRRSFIVYAMILDEFLCLQGARTCENIF
jgi:hypothetical protein